MSDSDCFQTCDQSSDCKKEPERVLCESAAVRIIWPTSCCRQNVISSHSVRHSWQGLSFQVQIRQHGVPSTRWEMSLEIRYSGSWWLMRPLSWQSRLFVSTLLPKMTRTSRREPGILGLDTTAILHPCFSSFLLIATRNNVLGSRELRMCSQLTCSTSLGQLARKSQKRFCHPSRETVVESSPHPSNRLADFSQNTVFVSFDNPCDH